MKSKLSLEVLANAVGCDRYPTRWNDIFEAVMDEYEKNGCYLARQSFYDDLQEKYGCFSEFGYVYEEAVRQVAGNEMLERFLLLLATALKDKKHKDEDLKEFVRPTAPEGENPIGYEMLTALALCSQLEDAAKHLRQRGIADTYIRNVLRYAVNGVRNYMLRHDGAYGFSLLSWAQKYIDGVLFPIGRLEITLDSKFKAKAIAFQNKDGEICTLAHQLEVHKSGMALGSLFCEDTEGSWLAEVEEAQDAWVGHPFLENGLISHKKIVLSKSDWTEIVCEGDPVIGIHIPPVGQLNPQLVDNTMQEIRRFLEQYFPELEYKVFACNSWLMSTQLEGLLGNGNIVAFSKRFYRLAKMSKAQSVFGFVFHKPDMNFKLEDLSEKTSLERALKKHYLSGQALYDMYGFIVKQQEMIGGNMMETRWLHTTSENFEVLREAAADTCVIPMGCVEKHGLHLPLGTDILEASQIAYMASQLEPVCVFPDFTFGDVPEGDSHMPPGSITLPQETEMLLLEQLCEQIARNGFKKIIIFNGHGGNRPWLSAFLRKLENRPHNFVAMEVYIKCSVVKRMAQILLEQGKGSIPELAEEDEEVILHYFEQYNAGEFVDGHGGFSETAYVIGAAKESVKMERLGVVSGLCDRVADKYKEKGVSIVAGGWRYNNPNALHASDPVGCSENIGKAALRIEAERLADVFRFIKEDEDLIRWHNRNWDSNL